ncbi:MAG: response regulator [Candidatus Geothermincolia bacterium]
MSVGKKLRVLVVEDDRDTAFTISKLLMRHFGVEVDTALDIASAKKCLSGKHYDVLTLDYQLPDGDGLALLEDLGRDHSDIRAIVITGHGDEAIARRAFKAGARAYVVKNAELAPKLTEAFRKTLPEPA